MKKIETELWTGSAAVVMFALLAGASAIATAILPFALNL